MRRLDIQLDDERCTQIPHLTLLVWDLWFYRTCSLSTRASHMLRLGRKEGFGRRF